MSGMFKASLVLAEIAREIPYFSTVAAGVGEHGVALQNPEMATA
jgi:hypothetical protein